MGKSEAVINILRVAGYLDLAWNQYERVDWEQAEELYGLLKEVVELEQIEDVELLEILQYGSEHDDWDSEYVAAWPSTICRVFS